MSHNESLSDSALALELRESVSGLAVPGRPALETITARGRRRQRRRRAGFAGLSAAGAAAGTALALGLTGVLAAAPAPGAATIRTAAFTLTRNANGTDSLTLSQSQMFDPAQLQQALARNGIPALVKTDTYCTSSPALPSPRSTGVLSLQLPDGTPVPGSSAAKQPVPADAVIVIDPAAMPAGSELFFDYVHRDHGLLGALIDSSSYTCSRGLPPGGPANR